VFNLAESGGLISQPLVVAANTVTNVAHGFGIAVYNSAFGGDITQGVSLGTTSTGNFVNNVSGDGIVLKSIASAGTISETTVLIGGNTVTSASGAGVLVYFRGFSNGVVNSENGLIENNRISANGGNGIQLKASAAGALAGSFAYASWFVGGNTITANHNNGFQAAAYGFNATQLISFTVAAPFNNITNNTNNGVFLKANDGFVSAALNQAAGNVLAPNGNAPYVTSAFGVGVVFVAP
jgi:parallel beta-helix repeat protein